MCNSLLAQFSLLDQGLAHLLNILTRLLDSIYEIQISEADTVAFCYLSPLLSILVLCETEATTYNMIPACICVSLINRNINHIFSS